MQTIIYFTSRVPMFVCRSSRIFKNHLPLTVYFSLLTTRYTCLPPTTFTDFWLGLPNINTSPSSAHLSDLSSSLTHRFQYQVINLIQCPLATV
jgi:hypothetical protein